MRSPGRRQRRRRTNSRRQPRARSRQQSAPAAAIRAARGAPRPKSSASEKQPMKNAKSRSRVGECASSASPCGRRSPTALPTHRPQAHFPRHLLRGPSPRVLAREHRETSAPLVPMCRGMPTRSDRCPSAAAVRVFRPHSGRAAPELAAPSGPGLNLTASPRGGRGWRRY